MWLTKEMTTVFLNINPLKRRLLRRPDRIVGGRSSDRVKRASELIQKRLPVIYHGESSLLDLKMV
jgi:hypothetical protein